MKKGSQKDLDLISNIRRILVLLLLGTIGGMWVGCGNVVGDPCIADSQCGAGRQCDTRSFEGYCTIEGCEDNTCPANQMCIEFKNAQTYCMATCVEQNECRDGYECLFIEDDTLNESIGYCRQKQCLKLF